MNRYEIATDAHGKYHARNTATLEAICGETDLGYLVLSSIGQMPAVGAWAILDGRDASCKTCEKAAHAEYLTTLKGA